MKTDAAIGLSIIGITGLVAGLEVGVVQGPVAAVLLAAGVVTAFLFSVMKNMRSHPVASDYPGQDVLEATAPGGAGVRMKGKNLPERLLGDRTVVLALICAVSWFMWYHHTTTEDLLRKNLEATSENTYVLSLNQAEREKLNIVEPESLKRKRRQRDQ